MNARSLHLSGRDRPVGRGGEAFPVRPACGAAVTAGAGPKADPGETSSGGAAGRLPGGASALRAGPWWAAAVALATAACMAEGAVRVLVALPEDEALSPLDERLQRVTLLAETPDEPPRILSRPVEGIPGDAHTVDFGEVPIGPGVSLRLLATTASDRLLGFGRTVTPLTIHPDEVLDVTIFVRKPYAYVTGAPLLEAYDTTAEPEAPWAASIEGAERPLAVATTTDGSEVVIVAGDGLRVVSTSTHARSVAAPVALDPDPTHLAVSADGRWAVVSHATAGIVSVVDLASVRAGAPAVRREQVPLPGPVVVTGETAWVLASPAQDAECGGTSSLVPVPLAAPLPAGAPLAPLALPAPARDLSAVAEGAHAGALVVALTCRDVVVVVDPATGGLRDLLSLPRPTSVAVWRDRAWAVGQVAEENGARFVLANGPLAGSPAPLLQLPIAEERARSNDLAEDGQTTEMRLAADAVDASDLRVLPDGRHVAILAYGRFHADEVVRWVEVNGQAFPAVITPEMEMVTYEYQLVDVTVGAVAQRLRTSCDITWERGRAFLDDWACASAPGQRTAAEAWVPERLDVLYGER